MQIQILQLFPTDGSSLQEYLSLFFYALFFVYMIFGQTIQVRRILYGISGSLNRIQIARDKARKEVSDYIQKNGYKGDPSKQIDNFIEYFTLSPVSLDPAGIMKKIEYLVKVRDERMREEVKKMLPDKDHVIISVVENLLGTSMALNFYYKVVRHYYLLGKKTNNLYLLVQLQMILPDLLREVEAEVSSIEPLKNAQPVGDGIGAMVAGKLMLNSEKRVIARDTVMAQVEYKNRNLYVIKAEGPAGNVGEVGTALEYLIKQYGLKPSAIMMIDAAQKLEGEVTGAIAEGIGAIIGGIGVDKYKIEEVASDMKVPLYAIAIMQSLGEAISAMPKEVAEAAPRVQERLSGLIESKTKEGDSVIVIGVGNTLGVGQ